MTASRGQVWARAAGLEVTVTVRRGIRPPPDSSHEMPIHPPNHAAPPTHYSRILIAHALIAHAPRLARKRSTLTRDCAARGGIGGVLAVWAKRRSGRTALTLEGALGWGCRPTLATYLGKAEGPSEDGAYSVAISHPVTGAFYYVGSVADPKPHT